MSVSCISTVWTVWIVDGPINREFFSTNLCDPFSSQLEYIASFFFFLETNYFGFLIRNVSHTCNINRASKCWSTTIFQSLTLPAFLIHICILFLFFTWKWVHSIFTRIFFWDELISLCHHIDCTMQATNFLSVLLVVNKRNTLIVYTNVKYVYFQIDLEKLCRFFF